MRRAGIDLSSTRCNVVEAEMSGRRRRGEAGAFRVHHFASLSGAGSPQVLTAELKALVERKVFPRRAWVNLWDVRSSHQYLLLPSAPASELESIARHHGASVLGMNDADVTVATTIGSTRGEPGHHLKTELSYFAAGSYDIGQRLRPIVDAGFLVEGVTTPCGALWSQARLRRHSSPGGVHAHVALGVSQSALGIFASGSLLYARDLDWGYASAPVPLDREELAGKLSVELRRSFLYVKQYWEEEVSQVLLCGDMPEIRSLTAPLIEQLNIEVETLDTLEGIDTASLAEGFADQAARFRLAASIAVEPPPVNLLPVESTADRRSGRTRRLILAAGTAAAVALAAFLYARASVAQAEAERAVALEAQQRLAEVHAPLERPPMDVPDAPAVPEAVDRAVEVVPQRPRRAALPTRAETPVPLEPDAIVSGILFSSRRRVALIDGRIVGPGDRVRSAVVRSIEPDAVVIEAPDGQTRRLELARPALAARPPE